MRRSAGSSGGTQDREAGMIAVWAIVLVVALSVVVIALSMSSRQSLDRSGQKTSRSLTYPHIQSAVTKLGIALQAELATERNGYALTAANLATLASNGSAFATSTGSAGVATGVDIPVAYRQNGGIWAYATGTTLRPAGTPLPVAAYHEPISISRAACTSLGLSAASCARSLHAWWQIYRIELPNRISNPDTTTGEIVFYLRSWIAPPPPMSRTTRPSGSTTVRVVIRPGRFADYLTLSDGTISIMSGATIDGPIHSNGFDTADPASRGAVTSYSIHTYSGVRCTGRGVLSSGQKSIASDTPTGCVQDARTNRYISFLRVLTELGKMDADSRTYSDVASFPAVDDPSNPPLNHAYRVTLMGDRIKVVRPFGRGTTYVMASTSGLGGALFHDDVIIEGGNLQRRFTIAANRTGAGAASIYIAGDVNPAVTGPANYGNTLGLIAQGDIVVLQNFEGGGACRVHTVRAAMIAATGGLTIEPQYTTQQVQNNPPRCTDDLLIAGSVAGHRSPLLFWRWDAGGSNWVGYRNRRYAYDTRLVAASPPYFPLTGTWQPLSVREANTDCFAGTRVTDATCR